MPPKGSGLAGAKAKARAAALEAAAAAAAAADEEEAVAEAGEEKKPKSQAAGLRKKLLAELGEKSVEEAIADHTAIIQRSDATIADAAALTSAQEKQVKEMQAEFDKAQSEVEAAISQEQEAAHAFRGVKEKEAAATGKLSEAQKELVESQKKVAKFAVMAANYEHAKALEEAKAAAMAATDLAKKDLAVQRQRQKEAQEATRHAMAEAKVAERAEKGQKRVAAPELQAAPGPSPAKARRSSGASRARAAEDVE